MKIKATSIGEGSEACSARLRLSERMDVETGFTSAEVTRCIVGATVAILLVVRNHAFHAVTFAGTKCFDGVHCIVVVVLAVEKQGGLVPIAVHRLGLKLDVARA